jgi:tetratricopeptide (TPR) repeat protein
MRSLILRILIIAVTFGTSRVTVEGSSVQTTIGFRKKSFAEYDTAKLNRYTREALDLALHSKSKGPGILKERIDSAELICEKGKIELPSMLHLARAEYFLLTGDFRNASMDASLAMKKATNTGDRMVIALTANLLGRYNLRIGSFKESIDNFNNCIAVANRNKLKGIIPRTLYALKDVYDTMALGNLKEYQGTLNQLIEASAKENDSIFLTIGYYHLGTSLTEKNRNFKVADSLLRKCLEIATIRNDTSFLCLSLANIGWNFYLEKKYDLAIKSYNRSLGYSIPGKRFTYAANALGNLGTIYRDMGETETSIRYYTKSIQQAKAINDIYNLPWVYKDMSQMYLRKGDTSNAYRSFVLYKTYSDDYLKYMYTKTLSDVRIKYDADTNNKELELLSLRLRNQRLLIYGYTGLIILSIAIGILLISRYRINERRRISDMNRRISEVTQANLRQKMNPHFIFNTLNSIQYYMYRHDKLATNNYLTKFSSLMRKVLENSQHTSVPLKDELDALNLYLDLETIRFKDKFTFEINIDEEIDLIMYKVPTMLIQPYVENAICHGLVPSDGKGLIKIDLKLEKDYISCVIEDNGIGRDAAKERKNRSDTNHNSLGTQIVASRLDLVNALYGSSLKTIYTDLRDNSGQPTGTKVEIQIPIMS